MKATGYILSVVLAAISFVASATRAADAPAVDREMKWALAPLELSINLKRKTILRYEPLQIMLVLENTSHQVLESRCWLKSLDDAASVSVQRKGEPYDPSGRWRRWGTPWDGLSGALPGRLKLLPGNSSTLPVELVWQRKEPIFEKTDAYRIWARRHGGEHDYRVIGPGIDLTKTLETYVDVKVVEPSGRDKKCLQQILAADVHRYLGFGSASTRMKEYILNIRRNAPRAESYKHDLSRMLDIVRKFPDSQYAPYCLTMLLEMVDGAVSADSPYADAFQKDDVKQKDTVFALVEREIAKRGHPRVIYAYAYTIFEEDSERAKRLLKRAGAADPDVCTAERIDLLLKHLSRPKKKPHSWPPEPGSELYIFLEKLKRKHAAEEAAKE